MNKVFCFEAGSKCDGCLLRGESLPYLAALTAAGTHPTLNYFISVKQFCSEICRSAYVKELNVMPGVLSPGQSYELVKE